MLSDDTGVVYFRLGIKGGADSDINACGNIELRVIYDHVRYTAAGGVADGRNFALINELESSHILHHYLGAVEIIFASVCFAVKGLVYGNDHEPALGKLLAVVRHSRAGGVPPVDSQQRRGRILFGRSFRNKHLCPYCMSLVRNHAELLYDRFSSAGLQDRAKHGSQDHQCQPDYKQPLCQFNQIILCFHWRRPFHFFVFCHYQLVRFHLPMKIRSVATDIHVKNMELKMAGR